MNRLIGLVATALVLGACGVGLAWFLERSPSADVTAAKMVGSCEAAHHLSKQSDSKSTTKDTDTGVIFMSCAWPPPSWADKDGYAEIVVRSVSGPGDSEASDANAADYIKIPCHKVQLMYDFGSQGYYSHSPPVTANAGGVIPSKYRLSLPAYPARDEVVYLRNHKQGMFSARCVS